MGVLTGQRNRSFPAFAETEQNSTGERKGGQQNSLRPRARFAVDDLEAVFSDGCRVPVLL
mgnify:CR=1 FL=1